MINQPAHSETMLPSSTKQGDEKVDSILDTVNLEEVRLEAERQRKLEKQSTWVTVFGAFVVITIVLLWSHMLAWLSAPDYIYPDTILGFSIWFTVAGVPPVFAGMLRVSRLNLEQHRVDLLMQERFPKLSYRNRRLGSKISLLGGVYRMMAVFILLVVVFAFLVPWFIGSIFDFQEEALWFGFGLQPLLSVLSLEFWIGDLFHFLGQFITSQTNNTGNRFARILFNWLIVAIIVEIPIMIIIIAGGRSPNFAHFILILIYNIYLLHIFSTEVPRWIGRPAAKGNIDGSIERSRFWHRLRPFASEFQFLQAFYMAHAKRNEESDARLFASLQECPDSGHAKLVLTTILMNAIYTERYEDALHNSATYIKIFPHHAYGYGVLAEIYADEIRNPYRALEMINVSIEQLSLTRGLPQHTVEFGAMLWAIRGWILQQLEQIAEADLSLKNAWAVPLQHEKYALADLNCRTGQVYRHRGDRKLARFYLQSAVETAPESGSAKLARKQLEYLRQEYEA